MSLLALLLGWARGHRQDDPADVADAIEVAQRIAVLAETDPAHPVIICARAALELADGRRAEHRALREVGLDVHGGDRAHWREVAANHVSHAELRRRRVEPGPLARRTA